MPGTRTDGDAVDIIEDEGTGYAVQHYTSGDSFASETTRDLWNAASDALNKLEAHLEASTGREL
jgi:hypothetical protein